VLAPNSPLRIAAIALAAATTPPPAANPQPAAKPTQRRAARYAWARLLGRNYEVFPSCARSAALQIRVIAFITDPPTIHDILIHLGEPTAPPQIAPACGPAAMRSTRCRAGRLRPPSPHSVPRRLIEEARKLVRWSCAQARVSPAVLCCKNTTVCNVFLNECLALLL